MNTLHVKSGDTVVVLSGKDKGKQGKVLSASPKKGTVIVEGVAVTAHHQKPRKQGETGGIVNRAAPPADTATSATSSSALSARLPPAARSRRAMWSRP